MTIIAVYTIARHISYSLNVQSVNPTSTAVRAPPPQTKISKEKRQIREYIGQIKSIYFILTPWDLRVTKTQPPHRLQLNQRYPNFLPIHCQTVPALPVLLLTSRPSHRQSRHFPFSHPVLLPSQHTAGCSMLTPRYR